MADEAGEDGGQAMASAVQHHRGGDPLHRHLGAAAVGSVAAEEHERVIDSNSWSFHACLSFFWALFWGDWAWGGGVRKLAGR